MKANRSQKGAKADEIEYLGAERYDLSAKISENQNLGTKKHILDTKTYEKHVLRAESCEIQPLMVKYWQKNTLSLIRLVNLLAKKLLRLEDM